MKLQQFRDAGIPEAVFDEAVRVFVNRSGRGKIHLAHDCSAGAVPAYRPLRDLTERALCRLCGRTLRGFRVGDVLNELVQAKQMVRLAQEKVYSAEFQNRARWVYLRCLEYRSRDAAAMVGPRPELAEWVRDAFRPAVLDACAVLDAELGWPLLSDWPRRWAYAEEILSRGKPRVDEHLAPLDALDAAHATWTHGDDLAVLLRFQEELSRATLRGTVRDEVDDLVATSLHSMGPQYLPPAGMAAKLRAIALDTAKGAVLEVAFGSWDALVVNAWVDTRYLEASVVVAEYAVADVVRSETSSQVVCVLPHPMAVHVRRHLRGYVTNLGAVRPDEDAETLILASRLVLDGHVPATDAVETARTLNVAAA